MATKKNKEKETAAAQAAPAPERQETQPATVNETSAEENAAAAAPAPEKADKKVETKATATKEERKPKPSAGILEKVGKAVIARYGFKEVYVTSDGQVFPQQSDARNHAADLANKEITKVTKQ